MLKLTKLWRLFSWVRTSLNVMMMMMILVLMLGEGVGVWCRQ